MVTVRRSLVAGSALLVALLAALATTVGLGSLGWGVGLACGVLITVGGGAWCRRCAGTGRPDHAFPGRAHLRTCRAGRRLLRRQRGRHHSRRAGGRRPPARTRSTAGLRGARRRLDVRCPVRRRGRRLPDPGPQRLRRGAVHGWVLAIGLARYAFAVAGWVLPWLRGQLPPRYWRKVVTAVQGIVLTVAAAAVAPPWLTTAALVVALGPADRVVRAGCAVAVAPPVRRAPAGSPARPDASTAAP